MDKLKILVIDDEKRVREEVREFLTPTFDVFMAEYPSVATSILEEENIDIAILDIKMPEIDGLSYLQKLNKEYPELEVIMITGHGDMDNVILAMRYGACDFLNKPFRLMDLHAAIERTKRFIKLNRDLAELKKNYSLISKLLQANLGTEIIGQSRAIKNIIKMMSRVAGSYDTAVLVTGESGTGKELVARGIHYMSSRKDLPFYDLNCSAIPENLFESEFFGHVKGSFTGALDNKIGLFETADKGAVFLDEVSEMPLHLQTKLLRFLDNKTLRRLGSHKDVKVDVRVIAATNSNTDLLLDEGKFRRDFFHRLNTFHIHIPPLRERKDDISVLAKHFLKVMTKKMNKDISYIDEKVIQRFYVYSFPGNVRELKNMVERAVILCDGDVLLMKHFPVFYHEADVDDDIEIYDLFLIEKRAIIKALKKTEYNKSKAADLLGVTWQALDRRIKKYDISDGENI